MKKRNNGGRRGKKDICSALCFVRKSKCCLEANIYFLNLSVAETFCRKKQGKEKIVAYILRGLTLVQYLKK